MDASDLCHRISVLEIFRHGAAVSMNDDPERPARILIVDDDRTIRELLKENLDRHGFETRVAANAREADESRREFDADVIILDVMMPGEDGLSLCRRMSADGGAMILILSALGSSGDRIAGLEIGADAYVAKPCEARELIAEIRSLLRRKPKSSNQGQPPGSRVEFDGWILDLLGRYLVNPAGCVVDLSASEFRLLRALTERPRRVLSRDQLLDAAYPDGAEVFDRAIDVQVSRLRRKLGPAGSRIIRTVFGEGYMFGPRVTRR